MVVRDENIFFENTFKSSGNILTRPRSFLVIERPSRRMPRNELAEIYAISTEALFNNIFKILYH